VLCDVTQCMLYTDASDFRLKYSFPIPQTLLSETGVESYNPSTPCDILVCGFQRQIWSKLDLFIIFST
jgi:hypothetical protein